ncbi:MAG: alpha/beta fold hydrolase [Fibrobacteria bacterium]|nr:alpha/beta fold hydrolase [Fibrobacteria bacterium]
MRKALLGGLTACGLLLAGCDDDGSSPSQPPDPNAGLLEALFAPATEAETTAIAADWAQRIPAASGERRDESSWFAAEIPAIFLSFLKAPAEWASPDTIEISLLSHVVDGYRHHGAVWTPSRPGKFPILVFAHGGDEGLDSLQWRAVLQATRAYRDSIAILAPSFRSEWIGFLSRPVSEGGASPWDRDVEDLRALVRSAVKLDSRLDTSRVCLLGYSRGGGVALLAAERDPLFTSVATIAAPTSFQGPWVRQLADSILSGVPVDLPGVDHLAATVLLPLQQGRIPLDSARRELIRRSASTWVRRLPADIQLHHGLADVTVPPQEMDRLQQALQAIGRSPLAKPWPNVNHFMVIPQALEGIAPFVHDQLLP